MIPLWKIRERRIFHRGRHVNIPPWKAEAGVTLWGGWDHKVLSSAPSSSCHSLIHVQKGADQHLPDGESLFPTAILTCHHWTWIHRQVRERWYFCGSHSTTLNVSAQNLKFFTLWKPPKPLAFPPSSFLYIIHFSRLWPWYTLFFLSGIHISKPGKALFILQIHYHLPR